MCSCNKIKCSKLAWVLSGRAYYTAVAYKKYKTKQKLQTNAKDINETQIIFFPIGIRYQTLNKLQSAIQIMHYV